MRHCSLPARLRTTVLAAACLGLVLAPAAVRAFDVESGSAGNALNLRLQSGTHGLDGALTVEVVSSPSWLSSVTPVSQVVSAREDVAGIADVRITFDVAQGTAIGTTGSIVLAVRGSMMEEPLSREFPLIVTSMSLPVQHAMVDECCGAILTFTHFVPTKRWVLFSVPAVPIPPAVNFPKSALDDDLGSSQLGFWFLREWDPGVSGIVSSAAFGVGRGHFLYDNVGTVGDSTEVDVDGVSFADGLTFEVAGLDSGFQEIGNPYLGDLVWNDGLQFSNGVDTKSLSEAVDAGWIEPALWTLAADESWEFALAEEGTGSMAAWQGGLILPRVGGLSITYTGANGGAPALAAYPYFWRVELQASGAGLVDRSAYFGFADGASAQYDKRDVLSPFHPNTTRLEISFDNAGWATFPGAYQQDVKPAAIGTTTWDVDVKLSGSASQLVTVSWPDLSEVPEGTDLYFIDPAVPDTIDMKTTPSYAFTSGASGSVKDFRILMDTSGMTDVSGGTFGTVPGRTYLGQNTPNPFNPVTTVSFGVAAPGEQVSLRIYSVDGRMVRELHNAMTTPGIHHVVWDGRSTTGESVGSGVYFYRLETSSMVETRKMTLLK
jgi:hypothetical protein